MKVLGMSSLNFSEIEVWSRSEKRRKFCASHVVQRLLAEGQIDLVGEHALPLDKSLPPGGRSAGNGDGTVYVRVWGHVERLALTTAARVVANGVAVYVDGDGVPLQSTEGKPALPADESRTTQPKVGTITKLRRAASSIVV